MKVETSDVSKKKAGVQYCPYNGAKCVNFPGECIQCDVRKGRSRSSSNRLIPKYRGSRE